MRLGEAREKRQHLLAFGRRAHERDQLLALVDHEHDLAPAGSCSQRLDAGGDGRGGGGRCARGGGGGRRRVGGHGTVAAPHGLRQRHQRRGPRAHDGEHLPPVGGQSRNEPSLHQRRLSRPRGAEDHRQGQRLDARAERGDLGVAPEEERRVGGIVRGEAAPRVVLEGERRRRGEGEVTPRDEEDELPLVVLAQRPEARRLPLARLLRRQLQPLLQVEIEFGRGNQAVSPLSRDHVAGPVQRLEERQGKGGVRAVAVTAP